MSHLAKPGQSIVNFITNAMGDQNKKSDNWRYFPQILMKAITANTFFFTRMMEMCQK